MECVLENIKERYITECGQRCYSLNGLCYSEHYREDNSQQVDIGIAAWMECVMVNVNREDNSQQVDSSIAAWMECVAVNIMCKVLHR
jgi:ferredoxin-like protein FixX